MGQRQILQHDVARHVVEVELLARWRIGLAGMRQRQQLLGQAAGAAKLVDDGAQPLLGAHRIALAQGVLRLGQHDGQGRAQLVRRVGQELRLFVQHAAMTGNVVIDGLDQRRDLAGHPRGVQRRQVVGPAGADIVAQAHQRPQGPVHPPPDQQGHQRQHAGIAQDLLALRAGLGLDALADAFGHHDQHLAMLVAVVEVAHHGHGAHRIVAIHRVEEDRLPVAARPVRRTRHLRHARQRPAGLARHAGQVFRPGGVDFLDAVILSHPGLRTNPFRRIFGVTPTMPYITQKFECLGICHPPPL
ncbi:Uncharacterised protein [Bordetella pertussis]|nr:Uncharacterised protein [Bordetella pertussis]